MKRPCNHSGYRVFLLVEAGGVEPPSENASSGTSPGADGRLHSLILTQAVKLQNLVASLFMVRSKLCAHTCTTKRRPSRTRGPVRSDGCVKPQRERRYRCSLIYKLPVFRMSGTSARYSRPHVPVETSTPPRCRKVRSIRDAQAWASLISLPCSSASRRTRLRWAPAGDGSLRSLVGTTIPVCGPAVELK